MNIQLILSTVKQLPYFTKQNLGVALGKDGEDLNYWIKKLTRERLIVPVKKGFYVSPLYQETALKTPEESELYWVCVANALRAPSYVSLSYVLSKYGIIPETTFALTSVTLKSSRVYTTNDATFVYQSVKRELFYGYQSLLFGTTGLTVNIAYPYKAFYDFLYLKPFVNTSEMTDFLLTSGRINWDAFSPSDTSSFMDILKHSPSGKMQTIGGMLKKATIL